MVDLDTEEWKIVFDAFLEKHGVRESFYKQSKDQEWFDNFIEQFKEDRNWVIDHSLHWSNTEQGYNFWEKLNIKWVNISSGKLPLKNYTKLACKIYPDASIIEKNNKKYIVII
jgi:hypothetical protein